MKSEDKINIVNTYQYRRCQYDPKKREDHFIESTNIKIQYNSQIQALL